MRKHTTVAFVLFFTVQFSFSQTITITGTIKDTSENRFIKNAVVALVNITDSVLYKFIRSDAAGNFSIKNVKPGNYYFMVMHPLFADYKDSVNIQDNNASFGTVPMTNKSKILQEVIVKSGSPIKIKGDTIIYTADSFKVRPGANVEELLRKMPGFQVGKDGELKAMGETVKNLLVDGEEFFGNDPGMVMKNLQANAVQEVQVYDKKSDQAAFTGIDDGVKEKTVNLKLKANKKQGYFGKVEASGGLPDNYSNSAMLNAFKGKRKISLYGFMSNTGRTGLGWQDGEKFGGGEMDGMETGVTDDGGVWMSYNSGGEDSYDNGRNGIPKNWNWGTHYSNKFKGDSLNINGSYRFIRATAPAYSNSSSKTYLPDTSWNSNSKSNAYSDKERHNASFTFEAKIDSNNTIKFVNKAVISKAKNNNTYYEETLSQNNFINNSNRQTNSNTDKENYQGTLNWNHKFKKPRRTFSATADLNISQTKGKTFLYSLNNYYKGSIITKRDTVDQLTNNIADSKTLTTTFNYTEPLTKYLSLGITYSAIFSGSGNNRIVTKKDITGYTTKIDSLSNNFDFNRLIQRPGFTFRWVKKKITANIGSSFAFNRFVQKDISKRTRQNYDFTNFFPSAGFNLKMKGNKNIRLNYNGSASAPSLQQLQPIADNSNPLIIVKGNPDLKQSFTHNISGGFNWFKPLSNNYIWSYFNVGTTENAFTQFNRIDSFGRTIYQTINVNGNRNANMQFNYNFGVGEGKKKFDIGFGPNLQYNRNIDFINGIRNINKNISYGINLNFSKYVEDKYNFYISPSFSYSHSTSSVNSSSSTDFWTIGGWADASVDITKTISLNTNANFTIRQKDPRLTQNNNYLRWNADIKKYVYKKELSVKFGINDILNQNRGYDRNFSTYRFTETYYNTLKRFWLLTCTWEFTHNKKSKEQTAAPMAAPAVK